MLLPLCRSRFGHHQRRSQPHRTNHSFDCLSHPPTYLPNPARDRVGSAASTSVSTSFLRSVMNASTPSMHRYNRFRSGSTSSEAITCTIPSRAASVYTDDGCGCQHARRQARGGHRCEPRPECNQGRTAEARRALNQYIVSHNERIYCFHCLFPFGSVLICYVSTIEKKFRRTRTVFETILNLTRWMIFSVIS